ncbi:hypothetical protein ACIP1G_20870 [Pseudomonas sp. NPDC089392]|uniref:hypothetical protein n=1 Tax=Pseudomonas sp. NPDC089392 TaxID=3364459 RepID=UPI00381739AD
MIDINDWPILARLILVIGPFIIGLPGLVIFTWLTLSKDYGIACSAIQSNPYLESMKRMWGGRRFKWRLMLICMVAGLITFPQLALHKGTVEPEELKRFPQKLKFKLALAAWLTLLGCVWMIVAYVLIWLSEGK